MLDCAAIVVTYNRKEKLQKNLRALLAQTRQTEILVIDNASTDGTEEAVKAFSSPLVHYLNTGENLGGAGGFSFGIREAYRRGYGYFWIMDDDCIPEPEALEAFFAADAALAGEYGFLSGVAYFTDGTLCNMNIQKTGLKEKVTDYTSSAVPVIMATFVSLFFRREIVAEFGLPIKEFFIWSDDLEYTRRISRKRPCYMVPASRAVHEMASNAKVNIATDSPDRLSRYACLYRNEVYVYRREGFRGWIYLVSRVFLHSARIVFQGKEARGAKLKTVWKSFLKGFSFRPEIEFAEEEHE